MTNPATPQLSESDVEAIEARANAASPSYCVDWGKGDHALLQAGGWRPANEEQPRTIATFDKDDGYVDLLFCAEARTDIPALIRDWRALKTALDAEDRDHRFTIDTFQQQERIWNQKFGEQERENTALREQLAEETKRADDNFTAYDRIKTKYSDTVNRLAQAEKERDQLRNELDTEYERQAGADL